MNLTPEDWHRRFVQQAKWTRSLRQHLFNQTGFENANRILEIGCGTGALLTELVRAHSAQIFGLDINPTFLYLARVNAPLARLCIGDAHQLPIAPFSFDLTLCHFLLLWVSDPSKVIAEMARLTRPGGAVLALAEPDYGGRIDFPDELAALGEWQSRALRRQGANPLIGRSLGALFHHAGLEKVETGVLGGEWRIGLPPQDWESEWRVLLDDLQDAVASPVLDRLRQIDRSAWERGERILFVPTFYAWGRVP